MSSPPTEPSGDRQDWLIGVCGSEIAAHGFIFYWVLAPLLGLWLPSNLGYFGLSVLSIVVANVEGADVGGSDGVGDPLSIVAVALALFAATWGAVFEGQRRHRDNRFAIAQAIQMPKVQGECLTAIVGEQWRQLVRNVSPPRVICQPNFQILAHAYEDDERIVEVSAGLAQKILAGDPLAVSILRHELAHIVFADLPTIRRQGMVAAAVVGATEASLLICGMAAIGFLVYADLVRFPIEVSIFNVAKLHLAVACAAAIVMLPLILSAFVARRYAGFIVALRETRADVCAGVWGSGLEDFSARVSSDPSLRKESLREYGLAYLSSAISHLPAQERMGMLRNPGRLVTPKIRYFAVAIAVTWLLMFHQGTEVWDYFLLVILVGLLHGVAVRMLLGSGGRVKLRTRSLGALSLGLLLTQILVLVPTEGLAYLAEHLTATLVSPGGFGSASDADYTSDVTSTLFELNRHVAEASGGATFALAILLVTVVLWGVSRISTGAEHHKSVRIASLTATMFSMLVSYRFFQEELYWPLRHAAYALAPDNSTAEWTIIPAALRGPLSRTLWLVSERFHGEPFLSGLTWVRLALPEIAGLCVALALLGWRRASSSRSCHG